MVKKSLIGAVILVIVVALIGANTGASQPPIEMSFRASRLYAKVLVVKNSSSDKFLQCAMYVTSEKSNQSAQYAFNLSPGSVHEVGILETGGWAFEPGEIVSVKVEGYPDPVWCAVP